MNVITASFFMVFHLRLPTSCAGAVLAPALLRQLREFAPVRFTCHCPRPCVSGLLLHRIGEEDVRLLAYSHGLISCRGIERACCQSVLLMALSGDSQPSYTHIAKFVRELGERIRLASPPTGRSSTAIQATRDPQIVSCGLGSRGTLAEHHSGSREFGRLR